MKTAHFKVENQITGQVLFDHTYKFDLTNKDGSFSQAKERKMLSALRKTKEDLKKIYFKQEDKLIVTFE